jgi:hypothetical protein
MTLEAVTRTACMRVHLVNPTTGKVAGEATPKNEGPAFTGPYLPPK